MTTHVPSTGYLRMDDCRVQDLHDLVAAERERAVVPPSADRVESGVPVYDAATLARGLGSGELSREGLMAELATVFAEGPGIAVFDGAFDAGVVAPVTAAFERIIAEERSGGRVAGDHFAAAGANDRVWNALEKLAVADPEAFVDYYANDVLALAATAWLGPGYQVTSQVNVVNPGGLGQTVHRDYHLGFLGPEASTAYPAHLHALSPLLTLQGAVAHCDMAVESGPTLYLPHSQKYAHGYLAYWRKDFQEYFTSHHVQLPLRTGDAVFFNPALFHAAGSNHTADVRRMANLLQVSSPFGRAMESVDRRRMVEAVYPVLLARRAAGADPQRLADVVAATAEGYPFPTNLDRDQPLDGLAPPSQADVVRAALEEQVPAAELLQQLAEQSQRRASA